MQGRAAVPGQGGVAAAHPFMLIALVAAALVMPELLTGLSLTDSYIFDLIWTEQFRDLVRAGDLCPRWLPGSWDGMGSPTFYFYPPSYFWMAACVDALSLRALPLESLISVTSAVVLGLSGTAMRSWLRAHVSENAALVGAIAYMAAPYRLYEIYGRGALAESCAYIFLPLVALAIRRLAEARVGFMILLAAAYAGLVLSHLPSVLLASLSLIPSYVLFCGSFYANVPHRFYALAAAAGVGGIGLSAPYLLPALNLLPLISSDVLTAAYFRPSAWFFWKWASWPQRDIMILVLALSGASLLLLAGLAAGPRRDRPGAESRFWALLTLAAVIVISGIIPFIWSIPFLAVVQFPWRLFVIVEFALVTAVVAAMPTRWNLPHRAAGVTLICSLAFIAGVAGTRRSRHDGDLATTFDRVVRERREAPEYLPRGFPLPADNAPWRVVLPPGLEAKADAAGAAIAFRRQPGGGLDIALQSPVPTTITVRRFYFPNWRVVGPGGKSFKIAPGGTARLLTWTAPAGRTNFSVRSGSAPYERLGFWLSVATLFVLVLTSCIIAKTSFGRRNAGGWKTC